MVKLSKFRRRRADDLWLPAVVYAFVTLCALSMLYPVLNVAAISVSTYASYMTSPWMILPYEFDFTAFRMVFASPILMRSYANTIFVTAVATALTVLLTALTAYPLSRPELVGKGAYMTFLLFTMMFSGGTIPNFLLIRGLGLLDTLWALILPGILSAYNAVLMINFFKALPDSLIEAAKIDGANEPYIFRRIVLPLSKPVVATIALFAAVGKWNSYFDGVLYLRSQSNWPVQLVLREIVNSANTAVLSADGNLAEIDMMTLPSVSMQYASLLVVMIPIMCVYPFLQRYFTKGIMLGAVKG